MALLDSYSYQRIDESYDKNDIFTYEAYNIMTECEIAYRDNILLATSIIIAERHSELHFINESGLLENFKKMVKLFWEKITNFISKIVDKIKSIFGSNGENKGKIKVEVKPGPLTNEQKSEVQKIKNDSETPHKIKEIVEKISTKEEINNDALSKSLISNEFVLNYEDLFSLGKRHLKDTDNFEQIYVVHSDILNKLYDAFKTGVDSLVRLNRPGQSYIEVSSSIETNLTKTLFSLLELNLIRLDSISDFNIAKKIKHEENIKDKFKNLKEMETYLNDLEEIIKSEEKRLKELSDALLKYINSNITDYTKDEIVKLAININKIIQYTIKEITNIVWVTSYSISKFKEACIKIGQERLNKINIYFTKTRFIKTKFIEKFNKNRFNKGMMDKSTTFKL